MVSRRGYRLQIDEIIDHPPSVIYRMTKSLQTMAGVVKKNWCQTTYACRSRQN